jgi:hypothetical protein
MAAHWAWARLETSGDSSQRLERDGRVSQVRLVREEGNSQTNIPHPVIMSGRNLWK